MKRSRGFGSKNEHVDKNPLDFDPADPNRPLTREEQRILDWTKTVRFRKVVFGGIREQDVWAKIEDLQKLYCTALCAERARYDALLEAYERNTGSDDAETSVTQRRPDKRCSVTETTDNDKYSAGKGVEWLVDMLEDDTETNGGEFFYDD